ncbi:hypothetical protein FE904_14115 [Chryseobacterium indologenes]|uniref:hypothetical protein n=1 Tax=Chryseobacterium indologenes TaxID=253 RepID=UPI001108ECE7|nr:hypothetical protein [Chryseobacterium indologenes]TLX25086.1 hypothetical protein FE904_14115 [Chryseobacterium indologenes]
MIFLSAQPDDTYFIWQLEIQLKNFQSLGIQKDHIHVVVGYHPEVGLRDNFENFINNNRHTALFFSYPDTRITNKYLSSIRPHLLRKHWKQFSFLNKSCIFYHDSDILLSRIPNIDVYKDKLNYVSDTRSYLDSNYIISKTCSTLFIKMVELIGLNIDTVIKNDKHVGGAQYILKDIPCEFWDKVETDSENIFNLLSEYNISEKQKKITSSNYSPNEIHTWYSDMWAVLWNLWYFQKKVEIHNEMNFSWPTDPIEYWSKNSILHYAGEHMNKKKYLYKRDYVHHAPWYDDNLDFIKINNCSYPIIQLIKKRKQELDDQRLELRKFILFFEKKIARNYYEKYFVTIQEINVNKIIISNFIIIPFSLIVEIEDQINTENYTELIFTKIYKVDQIFTKAFSKVLDSEILELNKGKFSLENSSFVLKINNTSNKLPLTITKEIYLLQ